MEESLSDLTPPGLVEENDAPEEALSSVDVEQHIRQAAEEFDLQAFIEGIRTARVTVIIYSRGDLANQHSRITGRIAEAALRGDRIKVRELSERADKIREEFLSSGLEITLEERSRDWQKRKIKALRDTGITTQAEIGAHLIAAQVVEPAMLTDDAGFFLLMADKIPAQYKRVVAAWNQLNGANDQETGLPVF